MKKYCRLCKKKESRSECGFGPKMWDKYTVDDASDKEIKDAAEVADGGGDAGGIGEEKDHEVAMAQSQLSKVVKNAKELKKKLGKKEKDIPAWIQGKITDTDHNMDAAMSYHAEEGLRDWFGKSKSKDGKSGWVNVVTGGTCASDEPGEGTPKCVSSAKRASMTKAERLSAQRRKKAADPGQQQKTGAAKPTYVSTDPKKKMKKEEVEITEAKDKPGKGSGKKDACYHKVKSRYSVWPSAYASGALVKCRKKGAANWGNSDKKEEFQGFTEAQIAALEAAGAIEVNEAGQKCWKGYEKKGTKKMFGKTYNNCVKKEEVENIDEDSRRMSNKQHTQRVRSNIKSFGSNYTPPSNYDPDANRGKGEVLTRKQVEKKRRKSLRQEEIELTDAYGNVFATIEDLVKPEPLEPTPQTIDFDTYDIESMTEATRIPAQTGNAYLVMFTWRAKLMSLRIFFPDLKKPSRKEVEYALQGAYPDSRVRHYYEVPYQSGESYFQPGSPSEVDESAVPGKPAEKLGAVTSIPKSEQDAAKARLLAKAKAKREKMKEEVEVDEDWQKVNRKDKTDGLSQKAVDAYRRENPGSKLKTAVTKKPSELKAGSKDAKRRKSFCSRMKGMKKRLTSAETARDPDSRINKALRRWNC